MNPIEARTFEQICKLKRDSIDTDDYWLLIEPDWVCLAKQTSGEPSTGKLLIPRKDFDRLVLWYVTGKVKRKPSG